MELQWQLRGASPPARLPAECLVARRLCQRAGAVSADPFYG